MLATNIAVLKWRHISLSYLFQPCFPALRILRQLMVTNAITFDWMINTSRNTAVYFLNAIFCSSLVKKNIWDERWQDKTVSQNGTLTNCPFLWKKFIFTPEFPFKEKIHYTHIGIQGCLRRAWGPLLAFCESRNHWLHWTLIHATCIPATLSESLL